MHRIALIEDNPDNRMLVIALLEDEFEVHGYENGRTALEGMPAEQPDLILLDISLPEMDGPQVLQHIRQHEALKSRPVIAITAHAMTGDRERFLAMGFDGYLSKPILDEEELIDLIRSLLPQAP